MRKLLIAALLAALSVTAAHGQISGVGQLSCSGATVTGTAATSGTSNNTVLASLASSPAYGVLVQLDQTSTITGGVITFQLSYDGGANYITVPIAQVLNPSTGAQLTNPYTLVASTNQAFLIILAGASNFQVKLTTVIAGSATVTPYLTAICTQPTLGPLTLDTSGNLLVNIKAQTLGKLLVTPDSVALPANQSVNVSQINGVTPLMGNGVTGTGSQRVTIASDNTAFPVNATLSAETTKVIGTVRSVGSVGGVFDAATGAAVPANGLYLGGNGSGNLTGIVVCDNSTAVNMVTATTTQIIAISGTAGRTYICSIDLVAAGADNVALVSGSGTNCASNLAGLAGGTTAATGWNFAANGGLTKGGGLGMIYKTVTTNNEVCLVTSAAVQLSGSITWTQF
jgi:hypothetical protein